jgi:hypothetical protein
VLEVIDGGLAVYVENNRFAIARGANASIRNGQGYVWLGTVPQNPQVVHEVPTHLVAAR